MNAPLKKAMPQLNKTETLQAMKKNSFITYLPSSLICQAVKYAIQQNKYLNQVFGEAVADYRRDDFMIKQLPALGISRQQDETPSRYYPFEGYLTFDIFLPISIARSSTSAIFNQIAETFIICLQQPNFFVEVNRGLVPLPDREINPVLYEEVKNYRDTKGGSLSDAFKEFKVKFPNKSDLQDIGDCWHMQLITKYKCDMLNYYAMLEEFGLNFSNDPNQILYQLLVDFTTWTDLEEEFTPIP